MASNYSSPLLNRPGAVEVDGVAWHYGEPLGEQRISPAIIDRSHRTVLRVSGPDAASFLHTLLSQKLDTLPIGKSTSALDLDGQGHILHQVDITRTEDGFYLDLPAEKAETLTAFLEKMIFRSEVGIDATDLGILTVLSENGVKDVSIPSEAVYSREVDWLGIPRLDIAVPREELTAAVRETGLKLAGLMTYTAARVQALEPEPEDIDEKSIAHEVWHFIGRGEHAGAVHLNKGCYRGQETVARVENLGRSPRLLVLLHIDGSAPNTPETGNDITSKGRKVGRVGTVVQDADFGPIALALLKRSAIEAPDLRVGDAAVTVDTDLLPAQEGGGAGREALSRLRGK